MSSVLSSGHDIRIQSDSSSCSYSKEVSITTQFVGAKNFVAIGNTFEGVAQIAATRAAPVHSSTSANCKLCGGYYREALTNILTSLPSSLVYCADHSGNVLEYYCTTCSSLICHECYMFEHKEHKYCRIQEAIKVENADITNY